MFRASLEAEAAAQDQAEKKGVLQSVRVASGFDRCHRLQQEKALSEDATVFTYDEIFESVSSAVTKEKAKPTQRIFLGYKTGLEEQKEIEQGRAAVTYATEQDTSGGGDEAEALPKEREEGSSALPAKPGASKDRSFEKYGGSLNCGLNLAGAKKLFPSRGKSAGGDSAAEGEGLSLPPSRFISKLVLSARRRELEREIIEERQLQKEREGDKNDEVFVTSAYKQRLEERRLLALELEEQERRDRENAADKKADLSSFHAHLLRAGHASRSGAGVPAASAQPPPSAKASESERGKPTPAPRGEGGRPGSSEETPERRAEPDREGEGRTGAQAPREREDAAAGGEVRGKRSREEESGSSESKEGGDEGAAIGDGAAQQAARLEELLQQRRREKQREIELAAAPLAEDKLAEAKRRYLERKRKAGGAN
ncbi:hypothetical protein BESB_078260 [Besnoitia besnoiti]|uniref:Nuclear speckle splicing regulatory protein 1 N-terminal domain-containing protein n=1 Tax=Besnoitia besnoiti TaxID=94643 RepID=A0A2A9MDZ9_BESBE|nr:hypothetical protein BESB_078260 [Besnoitia besnoiti]PFH33610.1 hypothetical protein BESB_078260 [Besnoitia besnoiti]